MSSTRKSRCFLNSAAHCAFTATAWTLTRFPRHSDSPRPIRTGRESCELQVRSRGEMIRGTIRLQLTESGLFMSILWLFGMQSGLTFHICAASSRNFMLMFSTVTGAIVRPLVLRLITVALAYLPSLRFHLEFRSSSLEFMKPANNSLQATRDGALSSASRFMSFGPACLSSGRSA